MPESDHDRGGNHVEYKLLGCPGLHPGAPGNELRPHDHFDRVLDSLRQFTSFVARNATGNDTVFSRIIDATENIRSTPRSGNADQDILCINPVFEKILPGLVKIIFGVFHRMANGDIAAGNQSNYFSFGQAVGGGYFRSIDYAKPSARAGSNIKKTSSGLHPLFNPLHQ